ncbi:uncharacterized protein LOC118182110 isoform X2 [Stegodyphus dumicola]|uniref:uncharacterized protein LOC118182110 isoform X2 n=1 Tax=Stegodyphus dumicola TaxID=202533 RepID=UPI0015AEF037|nr:uncharacterized protein LOC118182110 isoform X2 [Stegodyphus dumicola]
MLKSLLVYFLIILISLAEATSSGGISTKGSSSSDKFISVNAACSRKTLLAIVLLRDPFYGILYARGYPTECSATGNGSNEIKLSFPVDQCGTKVIEKPDGSIQFDVYMYLQYEKHVQQASDDIIQVQCVPQDVVVSSRMVPAKTPETGHITTNTQLTTQAPSLSFDSWMDILKGKMPSAVPITEYVNVGEDVTMLVKIRHKEGVEAKVIDCVASDGSEENQQLLIDSNGCTVDPAIMPKLQEKYNSKTGMKMVYTTFKVFRFPERDNLHLQCRVLVCNITCPLESCVKPRWGSRGRSRSKRSESYAYYVMDEMEVFNSVEVRAPQMDVSPHRPASTAESFKESAGSSVKQDEIFCLNSTRMIAIIAILLGVLLISLVVTICMCVRARELRRRLVQRQSLPYGRVPEYS